MKERASTYLQSRGLPSSVGSSDNQNFRLPSDTNINRHRFQFIPRRLRPGLPPFVPLRRPGPPPIPFSQVFLLEPRPQQQRVPQPPDAHDVLSTGGCNGGVGDGAAGFAGGCGGRFRGTARLGGAREGAEARDRAVYPAAVAGAGTRRVQPDHLKQKLS